MHANAHLHTSVYLCLYDIYPRICFPAYVYLCMWDNCGASGCDRVALDSTVRYLAVRTSRFFVRLLIRDFVSIRQTNMDIGGNIDEKSSNKSP